MDATQWFVPYTLVIHIETQPAHHPSTHTPHPQKPQHHQTPNKPQHPHHQKPSTPAHHKTPAADTHKKPGDKKNPAHKSASRETPGRGEEIVADNSKHVREGVIQ